MARPKKTKEDLLVEYRRIIAVDVPRSLQFTEAKKLSPEAQ
jgi:hypothetical protein